MCKYICSLKAATLRRKKYRSFPLFLPFGLNVTFNVSARGSTSRRSVHMFLPATSAIVLAPWGCLYIWYHNMEQKRRADLRGKRFAFTQNDKTALLAGSHQSATCPHTTHPGTFSQNCWLGVHACMHHVERDFLEREDSSRSHSINHTMHTLCGTDFRARFPESRES